MSCLIRESLADCALEREIGAHFIVDAKLGAGVLADVKLSQIAGQGASRRRADRRQRGRASTR